MNPRNQRTDEFPRDQALLGHARRSLRSRGVDPPGPSAPAAWNDQIVRSARQASRIRVWRAIRESSSRTSGGINPAARQIPSLLVSLLLVAILLLTQSRAAAGEEPPAAAPISVSPFQDDANLHDVQFVDNEHGWTVGDHGVIWQTIDGGHAWRLLNCPGECALRSVCFLTDRVGWAAGGTTTPYTRLGVGVLLATTDGGRNWTEVSRGRMPQLHYVRFFSPSTGILVGEATAEFPAGVLITRDGGKSWKAVEGVRRPGWRGADFLSPETGVAVGLDGTTARVEAKLADVRVGSFGPRGLYGVKISGDDTGWLVGDGGLVLRTENRGVVWQSPPAPLPEEAADLFNFRTVAVRGSHVWIAGTPGSVVWHSPNGGHNWSPQPTGRTAPIERLSFQSEQFGWAVGAFGSILRTDDGGKSWQALRGGNRRAALLSFAPRASEISFAVLAKQSAELGFRSAVMLPFRSADEGAANLPQEFDLRLHDAVLSAGGAHGSIGWQLPLDVPGLDRDGEKLIAEWIRRTEGRLRDTVYGNLVREIRTWRPSAILVDDPAPDDDAGRLLVDAVVEAVRQAGDPTCFPAQRDLAGLSPWKTPRVFAKVRPGSAANFVIQSNDRLPRLRTTVAAVVAATSSRLVPVDADAPESESYRLLVPSRESGAGAESRETAVSDFFGGLDIGPDARRELLPITTEVDESALRRAERDRNFRAYLKQRTKTARHGAELLAMVRSATRGDEPSTAAMQTATLADAFRRNCQWTLAEAAYVDLVERYPSEPVSLDAMRWLLEYWTSGELTYQRLRASIPQKDHLEFAHAPIGETIEKAMRVATTDPAKRDPTESVGTPDVTRFVTQAGHLRVNGTEDWFDVELRNQHEHAVRMAELIRRTSPALFQSPQVQLPLVSLLRQCNLTALPADKSARPKPGLKKEAVAENPLVRIDLPTQKTVNCANTAARPELNALLSDECWQKAIEIPLSPETGAPPGDAPHAFAMLSHDSQYLYFAFSVPRVPGVRKDGVVKWGRQHDQDLSAYDRIALCIDTDRDFLTWYTIEIDQRGCVSESCCGDPSWNPTLYIAADADDDHWRIEGAIPFSDLVAHTPKGGEQWNLAILRTVPAVRLESWSHPAASRPRPETFGVLRFQ